jgi:hypothetical protein
MSDEAISLLDAFKSATFEASLITTFNATLPFYEEVVLRRLMSAGSRQNVVLMDAAQCARSWSTPSLRPKFAGQAYTLLPISAPGAFHPKITLLAGKKRSLLRIGSHNLTLSGFGLNREVTNSIEIAADSGPAHKLVLGHAWSLVCEWVRTQEALLAPTLVEAVMRVGKLLPLQPVIASEVDDIRLLGQSVGVPSLIAQLDEALPRPPKRVVVIGAFFDKEHRFLHELESRWPGATIRTVIDPATVRLGSRAGTFRTKFVDAGKLWPNHRDGYLHAKGILLDFGDSLSLVTGSANPSAPAWLLGPRSNFEAMLLRPRVSVEESSFVRDLFSAFSAPTMGEAELRAVPTNDSEGECDEDEAAAPIVVVPLLKGTTRVTVPAAASKAMTDAAIYFGDGTPSQPATVDRSSQEDAEIELGTLSNAARWLELSGCGDRRLRVIIHHEQSLQPSAERSDRAKLKDALANLDFSGANAEALIQIIEKAIFDDEVLVAHHAPGAGSTGSPPTGIGGRPASLAVHLDETSRPSKKRHRVLQDGSLVDVLDALLHRLGIGLAPGNSDLKRLDPVSEEENIDSQEELPEEEESAGTTKDAIGRLRSRLKLILKRMIKQLKAAVGAKTQPLLEQKAKTALGQLVAVLSLVREFRRLRHLPQWRPALGFLDEDCRRELLTASMSAFFGGACGLAKYVRIKGEDDPEELGQVRALLAWLAWDLGDGLRGRIEPMALPQKKRELASSYANLFELLPALAFDEEESARLEASIAMTKKPTAEEGARAESWLKYHLGLGQELATAPDETFDDRADLRVGDLMRLPGSSPAQLRVVTEVTSHAVRLTEFDSDRNFSRFAGRKPMNATA